MKTANEVTGRLEAIRRRIEAAGGDPAAITVVAVTKGFGSDAVSAAVDAGLADIGENYAQELLAKADAIDAPPTWHFVGRLQRNKVRGLAPHIGLWQSVDRPVLGTEIARRAPGAAVLAQVDITGEPNKGGCPPEEVEGLVDSLRADGLDVRGLMAVGAIGSAEAIRPGFRLVRELADRLGLTVRSMGMSGDLEVAVQEGATMVRVGTALFGPRNPRADRNRMGN